MHLKSPAFIVLLIYTFSSKAATQNICDQQVSGLNGPVIFRHSWNVRVPSDEGSDFLHLSLCEPLSFKDGSPAASCNGKLLCRVKDGKVVTSVDLAVNSSNVEISNPAWAFIQGGRCSGKEGQVFKVGIRFTCAPHLGSPEFYLETPCVLFLMWRTLAACPRTSARREVPCYAHSTEGSRYDLSALIKNVGGYGVESTVSNLDMRINICSDMQPDDGLSYPEKSGACIMKDGKCVSVGDVHTGLALDGAELSLTYQTTVLSTLRSACDSPPKTVIKFRCPGRRNSHPPRLVSDLNCHYIVEWETQHACPVEFLTGNASTCEFASNLHGVDINLSPLHKADGPYRINSMVNGTNMSFVFNVCGKGLQRPSTCGGVKRFYNVAICALAGSTPISLGLVRDPTLQLVDNVAFLTFRDGNPCNGSSSTWSSVIRFICNEDKGIGGMQLDWIDTTNCMYNFVWETVHACPIKQSSGCVIRSGAIRIDLSPLSRSKGTAPWAALGRLEKGSDRAFYINVCAEVERSGPTEGCSAGSTVCVTNGTKGSLSYGSNTAIPVYDKENRVVTVTSSGDSCGPGKNYRSIVTFICKPGAVTAGPVLIREVESECLLEFEWHTAVACPQRTKVGNDCKVVDEESGFELDLSPLTSQKPYQLEHKGYRFYLNVCGNLSGTPCNTGSQGAGVGICQVSIANSHSWVLGRANSRLTYIDGMLNLTYVNGTPYNDPRKTPRTSSIAFLCDYDAGIGRPQFLDESNRTYSFLWYTSYACPPSYFTGCVYRDPESNLSYDLSRLNQQSDGGDWIVEEPEVGYTRKYYLSVCQPLRRAPLGCSSKAAICVTHYFDNGTELVAVGNGGQARKSPRIDHGTLVLKYDMGESCETYGKRVNFTTTVHLLCDPKQPESLRLIQNQGRCNLRFIWVTHLACPVSHLEARGSCSLTDKTGNVYSLSSLHMTDSFYTVLHGEVVYELNICGSLNKGHCASLVNSSVCKVTGTKVTQLARTDGMSLSSDEPGSLRLTYVGNYTNISAEASKVLIEASCNRSVNGHHLSFERSEPNLHVFRLATPLACEPKQVDCTFSDTLGNRYDLSPLVRHSGNWDVVHPASTRRFHLSFCQPLNPSSLGYSCPVGTASCESNATYPLQEAVSWGTLGTSPTVTRDGMVIINYRSGAPCPGKETVARSTVITLICNEKEEQPVFMGESDNCEILFNIQTPAACPLKTAEGDGCQVQDPRYGYVYDLSSLGNSTADYRVEALGFTYLINVCQPLVSAQGCTGAAACQTKAGDAHFRMDTGHPSNKVHYRNGLITLTYPDGQGGCKGSFNRTTVLLFVCDHSTQGREGPTFLSESEECTYTFEWRTSLACPPIVESECSVALENGVVDLSPLSNQRDNYVVSLPGGPKYVLNICRSVVYKPGSMCEKTAGSCAVLQPHITQNMGQVKSPPYVEGGVVKLKYSSGDLCNRRTLNGAMTRMETVIEFECKKDAQIGAPTFFRQEDCTYYFRWATVFACSMKDDIVYRNCTVVHPLTGEQFDLTSLRRAEPYNLTFNGSAYSLSVCGPLPQSVCGAGAGSCLKKGTAAVNLGRANSDIHFREGSMFLEYTDGERCPWSHNSYRKTIVVFACASAGYSHLGPQLAHVDSDCTYYFVWHTEHACRRVLHCTVEGTERFDLSPLIKSTGRHSVLNAIDPGYSYYINVCRPLHAVAPYHMFANAGLVRISKYTSIVESLGEVVMEPFNDFENHVTLLYLNGSLCSFNTSATNKARVIFVCDPSTTVEQPVLLDIDKENCVFVFEWKTNLVCPEIDRKAEPGPNCTFSIPQHGLSFDLSSLHQKSSTTFEVSDPTGEGKFLVDVCGQAPLNVSGCKDSSVCFVSANHEEGYGTLHSFTYFQGLLKVKYTNGTACSGSEAPFHSAEIDFECSLDAGMGVPVLEHKYACHSVFHWKTSLVCVADHKQCTASSGNDFYDLGLLSSISHTWNVTDREGNMYWLNICNDVNGASAQSCPNGAAICMKNSGYPGQGSTIGKVSSQKIAVIKPGELHLSYGGGDPSVCHEPTSQHPETMVEFVCDPSGSIVGLLELISGPTSDRCLFVFRWRTRVACSVKNDVLVPENGGIIVDKRLNLAMNFSEIFNSTFNVTEHRHGKEAYVYAIRLGETPFSNFPEECSLASVCQTKEAAGFYRDVGSYGTRKFVIRGSELLLEMTSLSRKCGRTSKNVTSVISFECAKGVGLGLPEFFYESSKCHYLFTWRTSIVCHDSFIKLDRPDSEEIFSKRTETSSATVGIVAAVVVGIVLISAVVYLLRHKLRSLLDLSCYKSFKAVRIPQYHYSKTSSQLHTTDENGDTELLTSGSSMNSIDDTNDLHVLT